MRPYDYLLGTQTREALQVRGLCGLAFRVRLGFWGFMSVYTTVQFFW